VIVERMERHSGILLSTLILAAVGVGCQSEPKNYDDCILRHVNPGMDRAAVAAVIQSCRQKFPAGSSGGTAHGPAERALTPAELAALDGRAGLSYGNSYSGTIYNGNSTITIKELHINVTTTVDGKETTRPYRTTVSIPPHSAGDFRFDIIVGDRGASYTWNIAEAKASLGE
jgi:hypothetical protein